MKVSTSNVVSTFSSGVALSRGRARRRLHRALITASGLFCAGSVHAAVTVLTFSTSVDGVNWNPSTEVDVSGGPRRVLMRASVSYVASPGDPAAVGFAACSMQPVFSNVNFATDHIAPFPTSGNNTNGGAVSLDSTPLDGPFGRIIPFASTGAVTSDPYRVHSHSNGSGGAPEGKYYRIARSIATNWTGVGPTTTSFAVNNFNGAGGLAIIQKGARLVMPQTDPPFNSETTNVTIMQFAIDIDSHSGAPPRTINIYVAQGGIAINSTTLAREARWFNSLTDDAGSIRTPVEINHAQISVIPAPGIASICAIGALASVPRRRRSTP